MIIFYSIFTSIAFRQRFAFTEISKYTTVINNTGRFDFLGIFLVLLSNLFSMSMPMYFASLCLKRLFNFKKSWIPALIVTAVQLLIYLCLSEYFAFIEYFIVNYCGILFLLTCNLLPIITVFLVKKENEYETQKS